MGERKDYRKVTHGNARKKKTKGRASGRIIIGVREEIEEEKKEVKRINGAMEKRIRLGKTHG